MARSYGILETIAKMVGVVAALLAVLSFALPRVGNWVDIAAARRFGAIGYVSYEIDKDKVPTNDGQLFLLRPGSGLFEDIAAGDKLQAANAVNFREESNNHGKAIASSYWQPTGKSQSKHALSGGWLKVATTAGELFQCGGRL